MLRKTSLIPRVHWGSRWKKGRESTRFLASNGMSSRTNSSLTLQVATAMENSEPTKRGVVGATAEFFNLLGTVSPVTILFKKFAQLL